MSSHNNTARRAIPADQLTQSWVDDHAQTVERPVTDPTADHSMLPNPVPLPR